MISRANVAISLGGRRPVLGLNTYEALGIYCYPAGAIVALVGWRMGQKKAQNAALAETAALRSTGAVSVSAAIVGPRDIAQTLDAVGSIVSPYNIKLSPKVQGLIDYLEVREGDAVKAGQVLIRLDPDTLKATVLQNAANVAQAHQRYVQAKITQNPTDVGIRTGIRQQEAAVGTATVRSERC